MGETLKNFLQTISTPDNDMCVFYDKFISQKIDLETLKSMKHEDLLSIGLTAFGDRFRILRGLEEQKGSDKPEGPPKEKKPRGKSTGRPPKKKPNNVSFEEIPVAAASAPPTLPLQTKEKLIQSKSLNSFRSIDDWTCCICNSGEQEEKLLLCDDCNEGYHTFCLDPPLETIPMDEIWLCPRGCADKWLKKTRTPMLGFESLSSVSKGGLSRPSRGEAAPSTGSPLDSESDQTEGEENENSFSDENNNNNNNSKNNESTAIKRHKVEMHLVSPYKQENRVRRKRTSQKEMERATTINPVGTQVKGVLQYGYTCIICDRIETSCWHYPSKTERDCVLCHTCYLRSRKKDAPVPQPVTKGEKKRKGKKQKQTPPVSPPAPAFQSSDENNTDQEEALL